jgi:hypothetical protein
MKKTYATPTLVESGSVTRETQGPGFPAFDGVGNTEAAGSVGFYL